MHPAPKTLQNEIHPPLCYTWQGNVETVHRLQKYDFFDRETFLGLADFLDKTTLYWSYFNLTHRNRGKEWQTPVQIVHAKTLRVNPTVLSMPPHLTYPSTCANTRLSHRPWGARCTRPSLPGTDEHA